LSFIETDKAECRLSVLINTHLLIAARDANVRRFFFSSSDCVYNADKQVDTTVTALKEPAMPEAGYRP
jgi:GDP-D-mannose 3', 5'-epimerase